MGDVGKYQIVSGVNAEDVAKKVEALLKERYQPLSGVSITVSKDSRVFYAQAMVRYKPAPGTG